MSDSEFGFDFHRLPRVFEPLGRAQIRGFTSDFEVDEILGFEPSGDGEHLLVQIRKSDQNSHWVAGILADLAGIDRRDVGLCGLKDRAAVTTQWFSLYLPGKGLATSELEHSDYTIMAAVRHHKKLRRGMHSGNFFTILLRQVSADIGTLERRFNAIRRWGVPNYFAEQRFGHGGGNLSEAQRLIDSGRLRGNRHGTGMYLSAARAWLFNLVLAKHIANHLAGDQFPNGQTGPLWGRGRSAAVARVAEVESQVLADWGPWRHALEHAGLAQERRNLILVPRDFDFKPLEQGQVRVQFGLPKGCFATAVLREMGELFRHQMPLL
ncbi:MAG: tRNA pseudouridine(13) synthase TruD [Porticoccaceae bacterium]|nr:tRNA pseudouridine(13) synthase TruD [Porticoccaceae bacterium]